MKPEDFIGLRIFDTWTQRVAPAFGDHISHIIRVCADTKVTQIDIELIVIDMHDNLALDIVSSKRKHEAMHKANPTLPVDIGVATAVDAPRPIALVIRVVSNAFPQACASWSLLTLRRLCV